MLSWFLNPWMLLGAAAIASDLDPLVEQATV